MALDARNGVVFCSGALHMPAPWLGERYALVFFYPGRRRQGVVGGPGAAAESWVQAVCWVACAMGAVCVNKRALWKGRVRAGVRGAYALRCCIVRVAVLARTCSVHDAYDSLFWRVRDGFMKRTIRCCGTYALKRKCVRGSYAQTYVLNVALVPVHVNLVVSILMHPPPVVAFP